jgi:hypothetical protein
VLVDNFKDLLQKPMDRKGFLQHIGIGMLALTGVGVIVNSLVRSNSKSVLLQQDGGISYGTSAYGGKDPSSTNSKSFGLQK